MADEVLLARAHADAPLAAAALRAVGRDRRPLDVAGVGDGDRHVLVGDQILDAELAALLDECRCGARREYFSRIAFSSVDDDRHQQLFARQNRAQPLDGLHQLGELVEDLLALEAGEALQLHVEDRLRLELRQRELRHQAFARFGRVLRSADQRDHRVEVSSAIRSPSRMCARASALRSSNSVRRRTTSRRNSMKCSMMSSSGSTRGRPPTIASMMMPKVVCSCVCL